MQEEAVSKLKVKDNVMCARIILFDARAYINLCLRLTIQGSIDYICFTKANINLNIGLKFK